MPKVGPSEQPLSREEYKAAKRLVLLRLYLFLLPESEKEFPWVISRMW